jgi:hypothetical protein
LWWSCSSRCVRLTYVYIKKVSFQIYITFLLLKLSLLVWGNPKFRILNKITFYLFLPCGWIRVCSGNGKGSLEQHLLAANPQIYCWKTPPFTLFHPTEKQTRRIFTDFQRNLLSCLAVPVWLHISYQYQWVFVLEYMELHDVFLSNYVILVFLMGFLMVPVYMGATWIVYIYKKFKKLQMFLHSLLLTPFLTQLQYLGNLRKF